MNTDLALELVATGRRIGRELGLEVTVAVVDAAGHPVALARGKNWHGPYLAFGKARLSAAFRKPTAQLLEQWADRPLFAQSLGDVLPQGVTLNPGGWPIVDADGSCIGAIGVGGGRPDQDDEVARRTAAAVDIAAPGTPPAPQEFGSARPDLSNNNQAHQPFRNEEQPT